MPITTLDGWIASPKQRIQMSKLASRVSLPLIYFSVFDLAGQPGAGVLAGTSTANGVVPTDATLGAPIIDFTTGVGYLSRVSFNSSVASRLFIYDMLFKAGAYVFTGGTTSLSSQPVISQRCPDFPGSGVVFGNGNQIWIEVSTAFLTGTNWQVRVTYTNSAGTTGRTSIISTAQAAATLTIGRMFQLSLEAGDSGVQRIESVIVTNGVTAMTAGAFNVLILRSIWDNRVPTANNGNVDTFLQTGMPIIYTDSCLINVILPDSTATGIANIFLDIASG